MDQQYRDYHSIEQRIEHAIDAIEGLDKPNIASFSREFHVPYNQLTQRVRGQQSKSNHPSTNKLLNNAQEQAVRSYIACYNKLGMPVMVLQLKGAIQRIFDLDHSDGKAPPLGQHFITR